jgi:phage replication initiation protein
MNLPIDDERSVEATYARAASVGASTDLLPRVVTRGETYERNESMSPKSALVDWLAFSVRPPTPNDRRWLEEAICTTFCIPREGWVAKGRGWFGYSHRVDLGAFGLLAYGGKGQKGTLHVELNAHACARVRDFNAVRLWGETYEAGITRVDLAHDDLLGETINISCALDWWEAGAFNASGRPPRSKLEDDLNMGYGKTLYVGRRGSGKLLRIYEKGKQLGDPSSLWVRAEVELHNKGRVVPWDVVTSPGHYLAGAYPALRLLSAEQSRLRTTQRIGEITYSAMVKNLRTQGGKAINVMCRVESGDTASVVSQLLREGVPKRLCGYEHVVADIREDDVP